MALWIKYEKIRSDFRTQYLSPSLLIGQVLCFSLSGDRSQVSLPLQRGSGSVVCTSLGWHLCGFTSPVRRRQEHVHHHTVGRRTARMYLIMTTTQFVCFMIQRAGLGSTAIDHLCIFHLIPAVCCEIYFFSVVSSVRSFHTCSQLTMLYVSWIFSASNDLFLHHNFH